MLSLKPALQRLALCLAAAVFAAAGPARAETPDETYKALGLAKTASPKQLYDALARRYSDPA